MSAVEWHDGPPTPGDVARHSEATDRAHGHAWGAWIAQSTNTVGGRPIVFGLRVGADDGVVWACRDGRKDAPLSDMIAHEHPMRWMRWLEGPVAWRPKEGHAPTAVSGPR